MEALILTEIRNQIAFLTINRPQQLNALNKDTIAEKRKLYYEQNKHKIIEGRIEDKTIFNCSCPFCSTSSVKPVTATPILSSSRCGNSARKASGCRGMSACTCRARFSCQSRAAMCSICCGRRTAWPTAPVNSPVSSRWAGCAFIRRCRMKSGSICCGRSSANVHNHDLLKKGAAGNGLRFFFARILFNNTKSP